MLIILKNKMEKSRHRYILRVCLAASIILTVMLGNNFLKDVFHLLICSLKANINPTGSFPFVTLTLPKYEALEMKILDVKIGHLLALS